MADPLNSSDDVGHMCLGNSHPTTDSLKCTALLTCLQRIFEKLREQANPKDVEERARKVAEQDRQQFEKAQRRLAQLVSLLPSILSHWSAFNGYGTAC